MSTNAMIGFVTPETGKEVNAIYCHSNFQVAEILHEHYTDLNKVKKLIALGALSELGERLEPIGFHSFDNREEGTTVAYHRDRGEKHKRIKRYSNATQFKQDWKGMGADVYLGKYNESSKQVEWLVIKY